MINQVKFGKDGNGSLYIALQIGQNGYKRAWIQHRDDDSDKNWAEPGPPGGRYLNIARTKKFNSGPKGNTADFPVYSTQNDRDVLVAFVTSMAGITNCLLPDISEV